MSFISPLFLWYFMPAVVLAVLVCPRSWRNGIVAVASLIFYASGAGPFILLLLGCMVVNFLAGPALEPNEWDRQRARRRRLLVGGSGGGWVGCWVGRFIAHGKVEYKRRADEGERSSSAWW